MADIRPFRALRPAPDLASAVASPPYDVLDRNEARHLAADNPLSFLRVVKPELELPDDIGLYDDRVYAKAAENLAHLVNTGVLVRDQEPHYYVYQQTMDDHVQTGIVAGSSVDDYNRGVIKKHENTRASKEDDRTRHVVTLRAQTGPVFLTYRRDPQLAGIVENVCKTAPVNDFEADDGVRHRVWIVEGAQNDAMAAAFARLDALYIADGHHRSAAAARAAEHFASLDPDGDRRDDYGYFLSVIFPHDEMKILDYNRVVTDLNGLSSAEFLDALSDAFEVAPTDDPRPTESHTFGMYLDKQWYRLRAKAHTFDTDDPVKSLDVSILQDNLLAPVLGIEDPRVDARIDFVGGIRGLGALKDRVDGDDAVAFALFPTQMEELLNVADNGQIMPPKSTWFEPKLRSGLLVRPIA